MLTSNPRAVLRTVLLFDAATCVATGLLMSTGVSLLSRITQLPSALLVPAGLSLFPIAAFIALVALKPALWPNGVWLVVLGNAGWVLASLWLLASGAVAPNAAGTAFVVVQAAAVALLAWLEAGTVRRLVATA